MYINFCFNLYCIAGNLSTLAELCWKRKKWNFGLFIQGNLIIKKKKYHDIIEILLKVALNTMKKYPVIKQYTKNLEEMFFPPFHVMIHVLPIIAYYEYCGFFFSF